MSNLTEFEMRENFMPKVWHEDIKQAILNGSIKFGYADSTSTLPAKNPDKSTVTDFGNVCETFQMYNTWFWNGEIVNDDLSNVLYPLICMVQKEFEGMLGPLFRCKVNLIPELENYPEDHHHLPHKDVGEQIIRSTGYNEFYSVIYYVMGSEDEGHTYFFEDDGQLIRKELPQERNLVLFNHNVFHSSSPCRKTPRAVVNMVFAKEGSLRVVKR